MNRSNWRTISIVTLWQVSASLCYYTVFASTPFLRSEFGLSRFEVGLVVTALTLGYAVFLLPLGAATDRFGEHRTLSVGLCWLAAGIVLVAAAPTYPLLLVAAFGLGSAYGTAIPGTNKAIFDTIHSSQRNFAMGIKQVGVTVGSGISALLVTGLAGWFFWQVGFLLAGAVGVCVAVVFWLAYRGRETGTGTIPDFRALASNGPYRALVAAGFFLGAALFTTTGYTVLYVEESIGGSVAFGGVVLALVQLFGSAGRVLSGWLSDILPGKLQVRVTAILLVQTVASAALFVAVTTTATPLGAAVGFSVLGFFVLGYTGVYYSCMATFVPADEMGGATAGGQLALTSGALVGPPAFGFLVDSFGYRAGWLLLAAGLIVAGAFLVFVIRADSPVDRPAATAD